MGVTLGTETVTLEKRLGDIRIRKNLQTNQASIEIDWAIGYYDPTDGSWHTTQTGTVFLPMDAVLFVMNMKAADLGLDPATASVGELVTTMAYGVITGQIPIDAKLTVTAVDDQGAPVTDGVVDVYDKDGNLIASGTLGVEMTLPLLVNATVEVASPGFDIVTVNFPVLQGVVTHQVTLTPTATTSTTTTGTNTTTTDTTGTTTP